MRLWSIVSPQPLPHVNEPVLPLNAQLVKEGDASRQYTPPPYELVFPLIAQLVREGDANRQYNPPP